MAAMAAAAFVPGSDFVGGARSIKGMGLHKKRLVHPKKRNNTVQRMRRGRHTYIWGHPNAYKDGIARATE